MNIDVMKSLGGKYGVFTETIQKDYAATILLFIISEFNKISEMVFIILILLQNHKINAHLHIIAKTALCHKSPAS